MCNRLNAILKTIKIKGNEAMSKKEMLEIMQAVGGDMETQAEKIGQLEKKVDDLQKSTTTILSMVQDIFKKLSDDKIEEKAYAYDQNHKVINNWKFWAVIIVIMLLAGAGFIKILDKADNVATIVKSVKK